MGQCIKVTVTGVAVSSEGIRAARVNCDPITLILPGRVKGWLWDDGGWAFIPG